MKNDNFTLEVFQNADLTRDILKFVALIITYYMILFLSE